MLRVLFLHLLNRAGARTFTTLALAACFAFGSVQAADSGPRRHAQGSYDAASGVYTVVAGDDLGAIAERLGVTVVALKTQNNLRSDTIEIGQKLVVATRVEVKQLAMIGFTVSDMDRSVAFYSDVLAFEKVADFRVNGPSYSQLEGVFGANMRIVHMRLGVQILELTQYVAPPGGRPIPVPSRSNDRWFEHMAIVVSDMDKAYEFVQRHRVQQISPEPQTIPASNVPAAGIKAFKFRDPDNHDLELIWFPPGKGAPRWQQPDDRLFLGLSHTAITVGDTEASLAFYRDLLGMKVIGGSLNSGITQEYLDSVFGARVLVTAVSPPDAPPHVEFLEYEAPPGGRPMPLDTEANDLWHWQTSLVVEDVEAAAKVLRAAGVRFVTPNVITVPDASLGFAKAIMVLDPDGHAMRLVES